ncbi:MAG TPA: SLBB domain-containing protein [Opitutaceae bacterium]|nr:SLBB domain-containing protein [Opitutaceae bacterium]
MKLPLVLLMAAAAFALSGSRAAAQDQASAESKAQFSISITGQVLKPGKYTVTPDFTVIDAIELSGGFTPMALRSSVKITHTEGPDRGKSMTLDYTDSPPNPNNANVKLEAGDIIAIPADPTYGK